MELFEKIPGLSGLSADDLYNTFLGLDRRGQILTAVGGVLVILVLLFVPVSCVSGKLGEREAAYEESLNKASEIYGVLTEYTRLQRSFAAADDMATAGQDVLQKFVYDQAEAAGIDIKKNRVEVKTQKPNSTDLYEELSKEVTLTGVPLDQTLRFLAKLGRSGNMPVKLKKLNLIVEPRERQIMKQVQFVIATIKLK